MTEQTLLKVAEQIREINFNIQRKEEAIEKTKTNSRFFLSVNDIEWARVWIPAELIREQLIEGLENEKANKIQILEEHGIILEQAMKEDELKMLKAVADLGDIDLIECRQPPRDVIYDLGIHHKRVWYLLDKWSNKGWYDYGVCLDLGWLTPEGKLAAKNQVAQNGK